MFKRGDRPAPDTPELYTLTGCWGEVSLGVLWTRAGPVELPTTWLPTAHLSTKEWVSLCLGSLSSTRRIIILLPGLLCRLHKSTARYYSNPPQLHPPLIRSMIYFHENALTEKHEAVGTLSPQRIHAPPAQSHPAGPGAGSHPGYQSPNTGPHHTAAEVASSQSSSCPLPLRADSPQRCCQERSRARTR